MFAFALLFAGCACTDPRGCTVIEGGNVSSEKQLLRDGRDTQTYLMTTMPQPPSESETPSEPVDVQVQNPNEPMEIDHGLNLNKIQ